MLSRERIRIFAPRDNDVDIDVDADFDFEVIVAIDVNADDEIWSICHQCLTRFAFQREKSNIFSNNVDIDIDVDDNIDVDFEVNFMLITFGQFFTSV